MQQPEDTRSNAHCGPPNRRISDVTTPVKIFSPSVVGRFYWRSLTLRAGLASRVAVFGRRISIVEAAVQRACTTIHVCTLGFSKDYTGLSVCPQARPVRLYICDVKND